MEIANVLGQVADGVMRDFARERMLERDIDGAVAVLDVEDYGVSTGVMPAAHQFDPPGAARGIAGHIYGANFAVFRKWAALFHDRLRFNSGNQNRVAAREALFSPVDGRDGINILGD